MYDDVTFLERFGVAIVSVLVTLLAGLSMAAALPQLWRPITQVLR